MGKSGNPAKRAAQQAEKAPTYEPGASADEHGTEDFDAFWSTRNRKHRSTTIMGETITLPASLPLQFEMEARRASDSSNEDDIRKLVGILFGTDHLDRWAKRGMDLEQFKVLLAWAPRVVAGQDITLAEVADLLDAAEAADPH